MFNKDKVAIHGSYYGDNFGDTLFVVLFVKWLKKYGLESDDIVLPFASERVRRLVSVSKVKGIRSLLMSKVLVLIGGGYLGEPNSNVKKWSARLFYKHLSIILIAYITKKPYIFIGVGAGPISVSIVRRIVVKMCNNSEMIIVRDLESKEYLIEYGVKESKIVCSVDSILSLENENDEDFKTGLISNLEFIKENDTTYIGIHLPVFNYYSEKLANIGCELKNYCSSIGKYKVIVFNDFYKENYDYKVRNIILENIDQENVIDVKYENTDKMLNLLANLDILVTSKLHCGLVANCFNKYVISISEHNKTERLYKQLGIKGRSIKVGNYRDGELLSLLMSYDNSNQKLIVTKQIKERAQKNQKYLFDFLDKNYKKI